MNDDTLFGLIKTLRIKCADKERKIQKQLFLSSSEYSALLKILPKEKITCQDFSERMKLSVSRGTRVIDKLFQKELIERVDCSSDRRCKHVWLTEKGASIRKKIDHAIMDCERNLVSQYSLNEIKNLRNDLKGLLEGF